MYYIHIPSKHLDNKEEEKMKEQLKEKIRNLNAQIMAAFDQGNFIERDRLCAIKDDYLDELIGEEV